MRQSSSVLALVFLAFVLATTNVAAYFGDHHYTAQLKANATLTKRADCSRYYGTEGSYCGLEVSIAFP